RRHPLIVRLYHRTTASRVPPFCYSCKIALLEFLDREKLCTFLYGPCATSSSRQTSAVLQLHRSSLAFPNRPYPALSQKWSGNLGRRSSFATMPAVSLSRPPAPASSTKPGCFSNILTISRNPSRPWARARLAKLPSAASARSPLATCRLCSQPS